MHLFRDGMDIEFLNTSTVKYELNFKADVQFAARRNTGEYKKESNDTFGNTNFVPDCLQSEQAKFAS